eukprot:3218227-Rhodomonas_salina.1
MCGTAIGDGCCPRQYAVLRQRMATVLAICGTDKAYGATRAPSNSAIAFEVLLQVAYAVFLRTFYAVFRCACYAMILRSCSMVLLACYAMSGTDRAYRATSGERRLSRGDTWEEKEKEKERRKRRRGRGRRGLCLP